VESFLTTLSPALEAEVRDALALENGESRLRMVVGRYIDDEGTWPRDPATTQVLAQQFLAQSAEATAASFGSSGLGSATVAGLAGGAIVLGGAKGAIMLSNELMSNYWAELVGYSTGLNPALLRGMKRVYDTTRSGVRWETLARDLLAPGQQSNWNLLVGNGLAKTIEREVFGVFNQAAWRGSRSALNHIREGRIGNAAQENAWVRAYVASFAQNQAMVSERTATYIIETALEQGHGSRLLAARLKELWSLSPRHARAVDNYRMGLERQDRSRRSINLLTSRYARRLEATRIEAMSRTEISAAFNLGREAQWVQAVLRGEMPLDTAKMWITAQDELVCTICRPLDGTVVELREFFPGQILVPPAHPNCRCLIVPVQRSGDDDARLVVPSEDVSKREIKVKAHRRADGSFVEEHWRKLKDLGDGELGTKEILAGLGIGAATALGAVYLKNPNMLRELQRFVTRAPRGNAASRITNEQVSDLFDGFKFNGFTTHVDDISRSVPYYMNAADSPITVMGSIRHVDSSQPVGIFQRTIHGDTVHHSMFKLYDEAFQGRGLGSAWNTKLFSDYQKLGFTKVELLANMTVGGYAWARHGFRPVYASAAPRIIEQGATKHSSWSMGDQARWKHLSSKGDNVTWDDILDFSPQAQKDLLLGSSWRGALNLSQVAKHFGGPDGTADHKSGTPQSVHGEGGSSSDTGFVSQVTDATEKFLAGFERDGEFSTQEQAATGIAVAAALALGMVATRGKLGRVRPKTTVYDDIVRGKDGNLTPGNKLFESLHETYEGTFANGFSTRIGSVSVKDTTHPTMFIGAITEELATSSSKFARGLGQAMTRKNNIRIDGVVLKDGKRVGSFDTVIHPRGREAFHEGLFLDKSVQGGGFAGEWTAHVGMGYARTGIEKIGAFAASDVGGYAWAQRGFDWRFKMPSQSVWNNMNNYADLAPTPEIGQELARMIRNTKMGRPPTPQQVANLGRDASWVSGGKTTWMGKEIMMGSDWSAVMDLRTMTKILKSQGLI
jgi:hypothetical protein